MRSAPPPTDARDPYATGMGNANCDPFATGSPVPVSSTRDFPVHEPDPHRTGTPTAPHIPSPELPPAFPRRFGDHYELLERVARTHMSIVYKARQIRANRLAAVKLIQGGHLATPDQVARFRREAQSAADLHYPGIVTIYDVGEVDGQHYFAMEWLEGGTLKELLADGPLPPRLAAELLRQVAEAVAHAHQRGVIHRDIKPHNILLVRRAARQADSDQGKNGNSGPSGSSEGSGSALPVVKLADFGLARVKEASDLSQTGEVMGTPSYMPPEQARGEMKKIGPWSDVYGLGAVLYQLLTGRPPFQSASEHETLRQVCEDEPVPPRQINRNVPLDLENVCLKCLAKEEPRRYQSAGELAEELNRFLRGEPVKARAVGSLERGWRWCERNRVVAGLMTTVALVLMLGTVVSLAFAFVANEHAKREDEAAKEARRALLEMQSAKKESNEVKQELERVQQKPLLYNLLKDDDQRMALLAAPALLRIAAEDSLTETELKKRIKDRFEGQFWVGSLACAACHSAGSNNHPEVCMCTEYPRWNQQDKHSRAFQSLKGELGQQIGRRLMIKDPTTDPSCLSCHACDVPIQYRDKPSFSLNEGVTCALCHGGTKTEWIKEHGSPVEADRIKWRRLSGKQRAQLGMIDLHDPIIRAKVCLSCHLGNAEEGKVVTHRMIAIGHPPLGGFELNEFCNQMPRHWQLMQEKQPGIQKLLGADPSINEEYHLVVAGAVVTLGEYLKLLANQTYTGSTTKTWPELTHFECSGCHKPLGNPSTKQPLLDVFLVPGLSRSQLWPMVLPMVARPGSSGGMDRIVESYKDSFGHRPFGEPNEIIVSAEKLLQQVEEHLKEVSKAKFGEKEAMQFLRQLSSIFKKNALLRDYDTSLQIAWAFRSVYRSLKPNLANDKEIKEILAIWQADLALNLPTVMDPSREKQLQARMKYDPVRFAKQLEQMHGILLGKSLP